MAFTHYRWVTSAWTTVGGSFVARLREYFARQSISRTRVQIPSGTQTDRNMQNPAVFEALFEGTDRRADTVEGSQGGPHLAGWPA
jgi:hypothetical protein